MNILYVNMKAIIATLNYWNIVYLTDLKNIMKLDLFHA